jgi:hypothetical protein
MTSLQELDLSQTRFCYSSWKLIKNDNPDCLNRFTVLNIQHCKEVEGSVAHTILCTMPNLKELYADYVDSSYLVEPQAQEWTCQGLKCLSLAFVMTEHELHQPLILTRLAQLTRLEVLNLSMFSLRNHPWKGILVEHCQASCLRLNLGLGLDCLKSLRRLRSIEGPKSLDAPWNEAEARWVQDHWKNLERLAGFDVHKSVTKILGPRIKVSF